MCTRKDEISEGIGALGAQPWALLAGMENRGSNRDHSRMGPLEFGHCATNRNSGLRRQPLDNAISALTAVP